MTTFTICSSAFPPPRSEVVECLSAVSLTGIHSVFGSAKEDAFLRDLTINSLFYNINEEAVEVGKEGN